MSWNQGHILTDDIVVNYRNTDKDDCLHFLTYIDTSWKELAVFMSPTVKRVFTSIFNAWFLKKNFDVKNIDIQGFDTNRSFKITFKGNKYIYSFIDSKFTTGSVSLLLHGTFGTYLYTGNFCYYPSFARSPVLLPVIEEKALTRLYLDNTYYEQPSNFFGFDELAGKVAALIRSELKKNIFIYAEKVTMHPLLAEIASKLEEKVYVCKSTLEIMKILGYQPYFTRNSNESRIFVDKTYIKKRRGYGDEDVIIHLNRCTDTCRSFKKIEKEGNIYNFYFYCHSNHKEICDLLRLLKPESMTFLFSEIDKSKISYNFNVMSTIFKSFSEKSIVNTFKVENEFHEPIKIVPEYNKSSSSETLDDQNNVKISEMNVQTTQEIQNLNFSGLSKENKCPLRIRKVPEINKTCMSSDYNSLMQESNMHVQNVMSSHDENNCTNNSFILNREQITDTNSVDMMTDSLHNYCKPKVSYDTSVEVKNFNLHLTNNSSTKTGVSKLSMHSSKTVSLTINRKLVKNNSALISNQKFKKTIYKNKCIDTEKVSSAEMDNKSRFNCSENGKRLTPKKSVSLMTKSKLSDSSSNNKKQYNALCQSRTNDLGLSSLFHEWMDKSSILGLNISPPISETINNNEIQTCVGLDNSESLLVPVQSGACERNVDYSAEIDFKTNVINGSRDNPDSIVDCQHNPELDHNGSQTSKINLNDNTLISTEGNKVYTSRVTAKSPVMQVSLAVNSHNHTELVESSCVPEGEPNQNEFVVSTCEAESAQIHTELVVSACEAESAPDHTELVVSACEAESAQNHTELVVSACEAESAQNHTELVVSTCEAESAQNHTELVVSTCEAESAQNHTELVVSACEAESAQNHTELVVSACEAGSAQNRTELVVSACEAKSAQNHTELEVLACEAESAQNHTELVVSACEAESAQNHTELVVSACEAESAQNHTELVVSACEAGSAQNRTELVVSACEAKSAQNHTELEVLACEAESAQNHTELVVSACEAESAQNHTELVVSACEAGSAQNRTELVVSACEAESAQNHTELVVLACEAESEQANQNNEKTNETYEVEQDHEKNYPNNSENDSNNLKRMLLVSESHDENVSTRKKLRSETIRLGSLQPSIIKDNEEFNLKDCFVPLRNNDIERSYFFSSYHNCHLPKFWGFNRREVRPRHKLLYLRNIRKCIENLPLFK